MAEPPLEKRTFTRREVREILKLAVATEPTEAPSTGRGLSLAELKSIGSEVGIDPARLEDAARAVAQSDAAISSPIVGIPTLLRATQTVDVEFDPARAASVLSAIRRVMGHHGEVSEVGGSLEWRTKGGPVDRLVSVSSRAGTTTIEASANLRQAAVGTFASGGITASVLGLIGIAASVGGPTPNLGGLALTGGFMAAAFVGLRSIVKKLSKSESEKVRRVVAELAQVSPVPESNVTAPDRNV